jgi:hypothetical protein
VHLVESLGAQEETAAVVEPGEGPLDDPTLAAEPGAVFDLTASDHRFDAAAPNKSAVLVVVVAAIGQQDVRSSTWPAGAAAHRRNPVEQVKQLGDVVSVGGGQRPGERQPGAVYEEMVLAAASAAVDRAGTGAPI